jgi:hypothetical protein
VSTDTPSHSGNGPPTGDPSRFIQRTFVAVPETIARVRRLLGSWLEACHLHHDSADLKLAVGQLVANAVRHGKAPSISSWPGSPTGSASRSTTTGAATPRSGRS